MILAGVVVAVLVIAALVSAIILTGGLAGVLAISVATGIGVAMGIMTSLLGGLYYKVTCQRQRKAQMDKIYSAAHIAIKQSSSNNTRVSSKDTDTMVKHSPAFGMM